MIDRYTTPEIATLWSPETKFATWLEIELLACEAQAQRGMVPGEVARRLRATARVGTPERIDEIERTGTQHDVVAFLRSIAELTGPEARYLHLGLGSSDVVDTSLSVLMVRAADLLLAEAQSVVDALAGLADSHRATLMAGRTHGMHAETIASEIRTLARTEIGEVEEPFLEGQTGSSAMPHKRNPILCERICGLARLLRGHALAAMEDQALWGERDISHSSVERIAIPGATTLLHYMLRKLAVVLRGLRVYPEAMRANLDLTGGLVFSHRVLLALVEQGLPRDEAYRIVQTAAGAVHENRQSFREGLLSSGRFTSADLDRLFDYGYYLRHVDAILERVGIPKSAVIAKPGGPEQSPGTPEIACHPANLDSEFAGTPTTLRSSQ